MFVLPKGIFTLHAPVSVYEIGDSNVVLYSDITEIISRRLLRFQIRFHMCFVNVLYLITIIWHWNRIYKIKFNNHILIYWTSRLHHFVNMGDIDTASCFSDCVIVVEREMRNCQLYHGGREQLF